MFFEACVELSFGLSDILFAACIALYTIYYVVRYARGFASAVKSFFVFERGY